MHITIDEDDELEYARQLVELAENLSDSWHSTVTVESVERES